jgi:hypothetical protein
MVVGLTEETSGSLSFEARGHDEVVIPFIWIPDNYEGPRPGYPWFEAGRMTLSAEQLAAAPGTHATTQASEARVAADAAAATEQPTSLADPDTGRPRQQIVTGPLTDNTAYWAINSETESQRIGELRAQVDAAVRAWRAVSDPRAIVTALDAASGSNPVVKALGRAHGNGPAVRKADQPCPPDKAAFFTNLSTYQAMARRLNIDVDVIMALSGHESG